MIAHAKDAGVLTVSAPDVHRDDVSPMMGLIVESMDDGLADATDEQRTDDAQPETEPTSARADRFRYMPLPHPIIFVGMRGAERTITRIVFRIYGTPDRPVDYELKRGLYLAVRGAPTVDYSHYWLTDSKGNIVAAIGPVPMDSWEKHHPDDSVWARLREICEEILEELEPETGPRAEWPRVEYLGMPPGIVGEQPEPARDAFIRVPVPEWTAENVVRHQRFAPGLHIAPFRGVHGELLIVAIAQDGGLDAMWPVMSIDTWMHWVEVSLPPGDWQRTIAYEGHNRSIQAEMDDRLLASDPFLVPRYADLHLPRRDVVHICPWFGRANRKAFMITTTNVLGCAVGFEEGADLRTLVEEGLGLLQGIREDVENVREGNLNAAIDRTLCYHPDVRPDATAKALAPYWLTVGNGPKIPRSIRATAARRESVIVDIVEVDGVEAGKVDEWVDMEITVPGDFNDSFSARVTDETIEAMIAALTSARAHARAERIIPATGAR